MFAFLNVKSYHWCETIRTIKGFSRIFAQNACVKYLHWLCTLFAVWISVDILTTRDFANIDHFINRWQHSWWNGMYSIMLTKIAIFHKEYLDAYQRLIPPEMLQYVDKNRNCEDIAMAHVVAAEVRAFVCVI